MRLALGIGLVGALCSGNRVGKCAKLNKSVRRMKEILARVKRDTYHAAERSVDAVAKVLEIAIGGLAHENHSLTFGTDTIIGGAEIVWVDNVHQASISSDAVLHEGEGLVGSGDVGSGVGDECKTVGDSSHEGSGAHVGERRWIIEIVEERAVGLLVLPDGTNDLFSVASELSESPFKTITRRGLGNRLVDTENTCGGPTVTGR